MVQLDKKQQILTSAETLFANKGFHGTSTRDIAEMAHINVAMISYYFGSKEKLLQALFEERIKQARLKLERLLNDEMLQPMEKIHKLIEDYTEKCFSNQKFYRIMIYEEMLEKKPVVYNSLKELRKQNISIVEQIVKEGQLKKVFKQGIDIVFVMNTLLGTIMQALMNKDFYKSYYGLENLPVEEGQEVLKKHLKDYLKVLFKQILSYEE